MAMFKSQVKIYGKHAVILQKYCKDKGTEQDVSLIISNNSGEDKSFYLFDTRISCYMVAAMLGIIRKRKSKSDSSKSPNVANIFVEALERNRPNLERIYHHMVLSESDQGSVDARIKKAFSIMPDDMCAEEQDRLEDYVRGGLEILDELFKDCKNYEDVCNSIYSLDQLLNS